MFTYENPILPGFYPDPSCILVDGTYYMANSSFQFFPGIPIHASEDLINWRIIGNAICRTSQLDLGNAVTKENNPRRREVFTAGLYAPTIRYHGGTFYIICTKLEGAVGWSKDRDFEPLNFFITTSNIQDPSGFSDPIYFDFYGIDPSLFFDDDDRAYVQGSWIYGYDKSHATTIKQFEIDINTGYAKSAVVEIWEGHSGIIPEGPHIYKKDGFYYLLVAEGGTFISHQVTIARSRSIWGPFESYSQNPLVSARVSGKIQCSGHAELFQDVQGSWWAVMLARREFGLSYPLGRETFLVPVEWPQNEFPTIAIPQTVQFCDRKLADHESVKRKDGVNLQDLNTIYLRTPGLHNYVQAGHSLYLRPSLANLITPTGTMTFLGQRQQSFCSVATATIFPKDIEGDCDIGLVIYKDTHRHASLHWRSILKELSLEVHESSHQTEVRHTVSLPGCVSIHMKIAASVNNYNFGYSFEVSEESKSREIELGQVAAELLSGDDFTGTVFGIFATGSGNPIEFHRFAVEHRLSSSH